MVSRVVYKLVTYCKLRKRIAILLIFLLIIYTLWKLVGWLLTFYQPDNNYRFNEKPLRVADELFQNG